VLEIKDTRSDRFSIPGGVKVDNEGSIYVTDSRSQRVTKFAPDGTVLNTSWTWETESSIRFGQVPGDVALAEDHLYVLDGAGEVITQLTDDGEKVREWASGPMEDDMWNQPLSVDTDVHGNLYLRDGGMEKIFKYDANGRFLEEWAPTRIERQEPQGLAIHGDTAYVAYISGSMPGIWTFDLDGNAIGRVVEFQVSDTSTDTIPFDLAVTPSGDIFSVDPFSRTVRWYAPSGELKSEWDFGVGNDAATTFVNLAVSDTGTVYVSDGDTRQILVFEPVSGDVNTR